MRMGFDRIEMGFDRVERALKLVADEAGQSQRCDTL